MSVNGGDGETEQIKFTVNRFGSVYEYGKAVRKLQGRCVSKVSDELVISEFNPDPLDEDMIRVEITRDGERVKDPVFTRRMITGSNRDDARPEWYRYDYHLDPSNFRKDGTYQISVTSRDTAGNEPEAADTAGGVIRFTVDAEKPAMTMIEFTTDKDTGCRKVSWEAFDAIGIADLKIYVDGELWKHEEEQETAIRKYGEVDLSARDEKKKLGKTQPHTVRFVVTDRAGNCLDTGEKSDSAGALTIARRSLLVSSVIKIAVLAAAAVIVPVIVYLAERRDRRDKENRKNRKEKV